MARKQKQANAARKQPRSTEKSRLTHADCLRQALAWFANNDSFTNLRLHGNVSWTAGQLVLLAVLWVWSDQRTLTGAFDQASRLALEIFDKVAVTSYQGFTGALRSYTASLLPELWAHLHGLMEQSAGTHWRIGKWLALAVDGSRATTPRTASNEQAFSAKNYGKGLRAKSKRKWKNKKRRSKKLSAPVKPQIWLTLLWHMGLKMPWCWKTGPSTACERHHLLEMLQTLVFPSHTIFCGDAGFVGYELWSAVLDRGHSFLIRVGANVRLLRNLGTVRQRNGLVYLWPNEAMRKKQPPLVLRILELQGPRGTIYLVTNVLSERELSLRQARQLYRLRWGVELQFRALKQTFGRGKLRSRSSANAVVELDWSLVGLWLIQLFAAKEQIKVDSPPEQSSVALALNVVQDAMRNWSNAIGAPRELARRLSQATKDTYARTSSKRARYRANYKDKPCATKPVVVLATRTQRQAYQLFATAA
jgi:Transposase DDE domain